MFEAELFAQEIFFMRQESSLKGLLIEWKVGSKELAKYGAPNLLQNVKLVTFRYCHIGSIVHAHINF